MRDAKAHSILEELKTNETDEAGNFTRPATNLITLMHQLYVKEITPDEYLEQIKSMQVKQLPLYGAERLAD